MPPGPSSACPGCGIVLPEVPGPTHAYLGASPACWGRYGEVLAREFSQVVPWEAHPLTVDAYAAQHPGRESRRAAQSVAQHLMALMLVLQDGETDPRARQALLDRAASRPPEDLRWLAPPPRRGALTILHVLERDPDEHLEAVRLWAGAVLDAWAPHHAQVRAWLEACRPA
jgi:hypothetical protein